MDYKSVFYLWEQKADPKTRAELQKIEGDEREIAERFALPLAFGTAGMRGVIGAGPARMNDYTVRRATKGVAEYIKSLGSAACKRGVVISYDTRNRSFEFALETAKVLSANGIRTYLFEDVRPVPICSFAVRHLKCVAGVMITASHNPKEYNGYKVYGEDGAQMSLGATAEVVRHIDAVENIFEIATLPVETDRREVIAGKDNFWLNDYITVIGKSVDSKYYEAIEKLAKSPAQVAAVKSQIKIVYTPIHGSGYKPVSYVLTKMGIPFEVVHEQKDPDINFSTVSMPNPEQPEALSLGIELAEKTGSDIVIGTDPDCDRMGVAIRDDKSQFVLLNGNQIGAMLMDYILLREKETGKLPANAAVVKTIVTTNLADKIAAHYGTKIFRVLTGFKFIGEKIKEWEETGQYTFLFGYEESFGYLAGTHARDKDAVVASMLFAEMACYYRAAGISLYARLQQLLNVYGHFLETNRSIAFGGLDGMAKMAFIMDGLRGKPMHEIAGIKVAYTDDFSNGVRIYADGAREKLSLPKTNVIQYGLGADSWVAVRPSGTEPKLKIYVSYRGQTQDEARAMNEQIHAFLKERIQ